MPEENKNKTEFSKMIFYWLAALFTAASINTMAAAWHTGDLTALPTLIEWIGKVLAVGVGFYYWKSRAENRIKLRKIYGAKIYNDAMKEDNEDG